MKKHTVYLLIAVITGILLMVILRFIPQQNPDSIRNLQFQDSIHGMALSPYYNHAEDKYYLFLPSYISNENVIIRTSSGDEVVLSGQNRTYTGTLAEVPLNQDITYNNYTIQVVQCASLPALFIEAKSSAIDYVNADKSHEAMVFATMVDEAGSLVLQQSATLSGRGNGTWAEREKLPYNLTLTSSMSQGPFTGIDRLCLLAEFKDDSKLRNALACQVGQQLDIPYTSPYMYTDLYINGEYCGLYGIVTKQEYAKHINTDNIKAVFEFASWSEDNTMNASISYRPVNVLYGDHQQILQAIDSVDFAISHQDWALCEKILDLDSLALKYTMDEFLTNFDMNYASQYFYLDQNNVLHCMLPWDYDFSLGSSTACFNNKPEFEILAFRPFDFNLWYPAILEYPGFQERVAAIMKRYYTADFLSNLDVFLSESIQKIFTSRHCDWLRHKNSRSSSYPTPESSLEDLEAFTRLFQEYAPKRIAFLYDYFSNKDNYHRITFTGNEGLYSNFCIPKGAPLWDYIDDASVLSVYTPDSNYRWLTESGLSPEDVDVAEDDLVFSAVYIPPQAPAPDSQTPAELEPAPIDPDADAEPQLPEIPNSLSHIVENYAIYIIILSPFVLSFLVLLIHEFRNIRRERRRRLHEQSEATLSK